MYPNLTDRNVLITGASSGIGEATAHLFAQSGANLVLTARRLDRLEELVAHLVKEFPKQKFFAYSLDVQKFEEVQKVVSALPLPIDVLVNNAGLALDVKETAETSLEDMDLMIDTNVKGLFYVTKLILPGMKERGRGHIINISSIAGHQTYKGGSIYCASKHAVEGITGCLRKELVATPLRVTSIAPGLVETEFSVVRFKGDKEKAGNVYKTLTTPPLNAKDVADTVVYVASRPAHVQIDDIILTPTCQASAEVVSRT